MDLRRAFAHNVSNNAKNTQKKQDDLKNDLMSQTKLIQIKENEFRKKKYYIFIWKHITAFSILSLLTGLFMKNDLIAPSTASFLITIYFIVLIAVLLINYVYFNKRNALYFHKYNWANKPAEELPNCVA